MKTSSVLAGFCASVLLSGGVARADVWEFDRQGNVLRSPEARESDNVYYDRNVSGEAAGPAVSMSSKSANSAVYRPMAEGERNERRTWLVISLTATMMVVEITAGYAYGSMALIADGWHMSTHAAAMLIAALAYLYARRHASNPRFTFGTGKLGDLGGFASAVVLALIALLIGWESVQRFRSPVPIDFQMAIGVAVIGLVVNLLSAWLLRDDHHHGHGQDHHHGHGHHRHGGDNNLRAAYLHVLADALTSVLAIGALLGGSLYGWLWLDPAMGIVGALVIARWSWGLIRDAGSVLVDYMPPAEDLPQEIRGAIENDVDRITDLHVWQLGPGHHGAIVSIVTAHPEAPSHYRAKLAHIHDLSHVTVEVEPAA